MAIVPLLLINMNVMMAMRMSGMGSPPRLKAKTSLALGYYASSNPANAFFYLITLLHGVHLLGGLVAWARTSDKVRRGIAVEKVRLSVELCAVYWHFLLLVWLVMFAMLLFT